MSLTEEIICFVLNRDFGQLIVAVSQNSWSPGLFLNLKFLKILDRWLVGIVFRSSGIKQSYGLLVKLNINEISKVSDKF